MTEPNANPMANNPDPTAVDWDNYDLGTAAKPQKKFPPKGLYLLRIADLTQPQANGADRFSKGDQGQLKAEIGPLFIVGGEYDGFEIRFASVSNKRYSNRNASQMGDFLLAAHSPFRPQTEDQWKQAIIATSGGLVEAMCDWDTYDKVEKKTLAEKMENHPKLADGTYQRWVDVADPTAKDGKRRVWANLRIAYFRTPRKDAEAATPAAGGSAPSTADLL